MRCCARRQSCATRDREGLLEDPKRRPVLEDLVRKPALMGDGGAAMGMGVTLACHPHQRWKAVRGLPCVGRGRFQRWKRPGLENNIITKKTFGIGATSSVTADTRLPLATTWMCSVLILPTRLLSLGL
jgi:hypothetical protein